MQTVHMQPLVSSLSASDRLVWNICFACLAMQILIFG